MKLNEASRELCQLGSILNTWCLLKTVIVLVGFCSMGCRQMLKPDVTLAQLGLLRQQVPVHPTLVSLSPQWYISVHWIQCCYNRRAQFSFGLKVHLIDIHKPLFLGLMRHSFNIFLRLISQLSHFKTLFFTNTVKC